MSTQPKLRWRGSGGAGARLTVASSKYIATSASAASRTTRRPAHDAAARFLPPNTDARLVDPATVFSTAELGQLAAFVAAMGADWCALDVLRDRGDGRIYVVDVNKTDAGPVIALPLRDKIASVAALAKALRALVDPVAA